MSKVTLHHNSILLASPNWHNVHVHVKNREIPLQDASLPSWKFASTVSPRSLGIGLEPEVSSSDTILVFTEVCLILGPKPSEPFFSKPFRSSFCPQVEFGISAPSSLN